MAHNEESVHNTSEPPSDPKMEWLFFCIDCKFSTTWEN